MRHHILFPTDFSDNSWSAIVYALKLYEEEECTCYILNSIAMKASTMSNFSNKLLNIMKTDAQKELDIFKKQLVLADANANHDFVTILSTQDIIDAMKSAVNKYGINMVIMGTKGATGAKEIFMGSNTVKVIKKIKHCPTLIIPENYEFTPPKQIGFPTDYKRFYSPEEINPIKTLSELFNASIRIFHINEEESLDGVQRYNYEKLKEYFKDYKHSFHWMHEHDTKESEINEFIELLEIDILAMINYKHSLIESITKEPVIKKLGYHSVVPFLVIPESN